MSEKSRVDFCQSLTMDVTGATRKRHLQRPGMRTTLLSLFRPTMCFAVPVLYTYVEGKRVFVYYFEHIFKPFSSSACEPCVKYMVCVGELRHMIRARPQPGMLFQHLAEAYVIA